jgi:arsenite methyltransferase
MSCCSTSTNDERIKEGVKQYYGKELSGTKDLKTSACTVATRPRKEVRKALSLIHSDVMDTFYGCGLIAPHKLASLKVLDLGSGSGRDCFVLAHLVGESGRVCGVDMTDEQLAIARRHIDFHCLEQFGYAKANVHFVCGDIERLEDAVGNQRFDLVVSNCVVNLARDKLAVLRGAFALLEQGGEMYFSDVYCDRRLDSALARDEVLYGECLSGALYWNDFEQLAVRAGFADPRLVTSRRLDIKPSIADKLGNARFYSATYRLFKIDELERDCEQYGQAVRYKGTIESCPHAFKLDAHHLFERGAVVSVCGNTFAMLQRSRFAADLDFFGDRSTHMGIFPGCGRSLPFVEQSDDSSSSSSPSSSSSSCC